MLKSLLVKWQLQQFMVKNWQSSEGMAKWKQFEHDLGILDMKESQMMFMDESWLIILWERENGHDEIFEFK